MFVQHMWSKIGAQATDLVLPEVYQFGCQPYTGLLHKYNLFILLHGVVTCIMCLLIYWFPVHWLSVMCSVISCSEQLAACEKLSQLRIWQEHQIPGGLIAYNLSEVFRKNFQKSLMAQYVYQFAFNLYFFELHWFSNSLYIFF